MQQHGISASTAELARMGELIDSVYQGATDPSHWNTVLPEICDWLGAQRGLIFTPLMGLDNGGFYFNHHIPEDVMLLMSTHYVQHDIWAARAIEHGLIFDGSVVNGDEIVPLEEYRQSKIYVDVLSRCDSAHLLGGVIFGADSPQVPTVAIALHRGLKEGRFHSEENARLSILLPHLSRSFGVMFKLKEADMRVAASLAALDRLNAGVMLFDSRGAASFANHAARRILKDQDGLCLRHLAGNSALGELIAEAPDTNDALSAAIHSAVSPDILQTAHFSRAINVPRPSGRQAYTLNFSSLTAHNEFGSGVGAPRAIAFLTDSAEPVRLDADLMKKTYGLTPAEIRVAEMLAECLTVDETADRLCLSRSTVKAHQQSTYEKTGTNSRAKLMKLLMALGQVAQ